MAAVDGLTGERCHSHGPALLAGSARRWRACRLDPARQRSARLGGMSMRVGPSASAMEGDLVPAGVTQRADRMPAPSATPPASQRTSPIQRAGCCAASPGAATCAPAPSQPGEGRRPVRAAVHARPPPQRRRDQHNPTPPSPRAIRREPPAPPEPRPGEHPAGSPTSRQRTRPLCRPRRHPRAPPRTPTYQPDSTSRVLRRFAGHSDMRASAEPARRRAQTRCEPRCTPVPPQRPRAPRNPTPPSPRAIRREPAGAARAEAGGAPGRVGRLRASAEATRPVLPRPRRHPRAPPRTPTYQPDSTSRVLRRFAGRSDMRASAEPARRRAADPREPRCKPVPHPSGDETSTTRPHPHPERSVANRRRRPSRGRGSTRPGRRLRASARGHPAGCSPASATRGAPRVSARSPARPP